MTEPPLWGGSVFPSLPRGFIRGSGSVRTIRRPPVRLCHCGIGHRPPRSRHPPRMRLRSSPRELGAAHEPPVRPRVPSSPHRGLRLRCIRGTARLRIGRGSSMSRVGLSD